MLCRSLICKNFTSSIQVNFSPNFSYKYQANATISGWMVKEKCICRIFFMQPYEQENKYSGILKGIINKGQERGIFPLDGS